MERGPCQNGVATEKGPNEMSVSMNDEICGIAGFRSHRVELDEVEVHCVIGGQGPAVVLLHGWAQNWWAWRKLMPGLAEQFNVIVPDLRGVWRGLCRPEVSTSGRWPSMSSAWSSISDLTTSASSATTSEGWSPMP